MTKEEVDRIQFQPSCHMSMGDEYTSTYVAEYNGHKFAMYKHTQYKDGSPNCRSYTHYMVDGKLF